VNRVWANFFGAGLVENVDDLRVTNPASNEELLNATARFLVEQEYDLKALMRTILQSATYQRSSEPLEGNHEESRFYARYYPKRLMAEVLLDAISQATGVPTEFKNYPKGWRAIQLPDSKVDSYFLSSFGRAEREKTCTCERTEEPSVTQVLHIFNGDSVNKKLAAKENAISRLLESELSVEQLLEEAYLSTLCRYPTAEEKRKAQMILSAAGPDEKRLVLEDLFWALMSSKEFLFNH
jgi:hypothetical protein